MVILIACALIVVIGGGSIIQTVRMQPDAPARSPRSGAPEELQREPQNVVERIVVGLKRRKAARIALSTLSIALLLGAAGVIGYPFYTNLYQDRVQGRLDRELASAEIRDAYRNGQVGIGDALTRIRIPAIDVDVVVVEGTTASALRAGAGHYPSSPLPCEVGNVAIAGHRTTYGRPFHDLDLLEPGDIITLETPIGECTYEVSEEPFVVTPDRTDVVADTPDKAGLTLTTCHPKGSARERLILKADMVSAEAFEA